MATRFCFPSDVLAPTWVNASGTITTDPNYLIDALTDGDPSRPCIFTDNPAVAVRLTADLGVATRVDAVAIPSHNLAENLGVRVQMNATNAWGSPSLDVAMTMGARDLDGHSKHSWAYLPGHTGYQVGGYQYLSIYIPANSVAPRIGEIIVASQLRTFDRDVLTDAMRGVTRPYQVVMETEYGVKTIFDKPVKVQTFTASVLGTDNDVVTVRSLMDASLSGSRGFLFVVNDQDTTDGALWVRPAEEMFSGLNIGWKAPGINPFTITLEEITRGLPL